MTIQFPSVPPGLYGEVAVAAALGALGFTVDMPGGTRRAIDGRAERGALRLLIQVKAAISGYPPWQSPGDKARIVTERANVEGRIGIFTWVVGERVEPYMLENGDVVLPRHKLERIYAATAERFAADVDRERDAYASELYVRSGKHGRVGENRNPNGLRYPVDVREYPTLEELIAELDQSRSSENR